MKPTNATVRSIRGRPIDGGVVVAGVLFVLSLWAVVAGRHPESIEGAGGQMLVADAVLLVLSVPRGPGPLANGTSTWPWRSALGRLSALYWGEYTSSITSSNSLCRLAAVLPYSLWVRGMC